MYKVETIFFHSSFDSFYFTHGSLSSSAALDELYKDFSRAKNLNDYLYIDVKYNQIMHYLSFIAFTIFVGQLYL